MRDYYEILDVEKNATTDEIKRAYRKLAKKYHPDLNPNNEEAEQKFKEATAAYEILADEEKRSRYDRFGHAGVDPQAGSQGYGGFGDIFDDIFDIFGGGFSSGRSRKAGPRRGADLRYDLTIDFEEAVFGIEKEVRVSKDETCSTCQGSGAKPGTHKETCSKCNGSGEVKYVQQSPFGQFVRVGTCDQCQGTGETIKEKCPTCGGQGTEYKTKRINVKIPAGVNNDSIISIRGEGEPGQRGGPQGDLYIYISVRPHDLFRREGNNIYVDINISYAEAALGAKIEVPTLKGQEKFTIPEGTQTGSQFRLKNQGVANLRGSGRGDLYFTVNVEVPRKLTERQKELLLEFSKEEGKEVEEGQDKKDQGKKGFFDKVKDKFN